MDSVSLQINLAPVDYPFAKFILSHQLRVFYNFVDEVILTVDLHKGRGRFTGTRWDENKDKLLTLLDKLSSSFSKCRICEVDYSDSSIDRVSAYFFKGRVSSPRKDNRGDPYFSYLYGFLSTRNNYFIHLDSDILFMGNPKAWIEESLKILRSHKRYLATSPLSSPTNTQSRMNIASKLNGFDYQVFTTRFFLMDKSRVVQKIKRKRANPDRIIKAILTGNSIYQTPEKSFQKYMQQNDLWRIEFPGGGNLIALHSEIKNERFLRVLPKLIELAEQEEFPDDQIGECNITESYLELAASRL